MAVNASVTSPADMINVALGRIGYKLRVGSLYEGSFAAKKALDIYAQTRDEILRQNDWGFAERDIALVLLKSAPIGGGYIPPAVWNPAVNPPIGYLFEYTYPSDCLKVRVIKPTPLFSPNMDPQPHNWTIANDKNFNPPQKVILCNVANALMTYTGQVTDPATWENDFVELFAAALGRRLAPTLSTMDVEKMEASDEAASMAVAETNQG